MVRWQSRGEGDEEAESTKGQDDDSVGSRSQKVACHGWRKVAKVVEKSEPKLSSRAKITSPK